MRRLTTNQARAFRRRWAAINAAEIAELRATSPRQKFQQLVALMSSAARFGWDKPDAAEQDLVRKRWQQLRKALRG